MARAAPGPKEVESVDDHRSLVALVAAPIEIVFVDYTGRDGLVLLAEIEDQRVRRRREEMRNDVDVVSFERTQMVRHRFGERGSVPTTEHAALTRTQSENDQPADLRQGCLAVGARSGLRGLRDTDDDRDIRSLAELVLGDLERRGPAFRPVDGAPQAGAPPCLSAPARPIRRISRPAPRRR